MPIVDGSKSPIPPFWEPKRATRTWLARRLQPFAQGTPAQAGCSLRHFWVEGSEGVWLQVLERGESEMLSNWRRLV